MKCVIKIKGNLSAFSLDKMSYPIFKYDRKVAIEMLSSIMKMILKTQKCPTEWKEGKDVMGPKSCMMK
jgi:hypothetical protein